ncbi:MAG TPA: bifunctional proline dehydrogenase/L-glutamate gamma-semialdehyde dehydrogenase PutA [Hyphomicrobiaceae bacterium]|nr:bifunctional proline dehydrogenase/L-glutamate gamma-semialdehyde dehydrogenase PutA [Hyphomicrobiaceae bacterium]
MTSVSDKGTSGKGWTPPGPRRDEIAAHLLHDERRLVGGLVERAVYTSDERRRITDLAREFVTKVRADSASHGGLDAFLHEYGLSSEEGVILMCLAEALLRIPDAATQDALIAEKIGEGEWSRHFGRSESLFVNASTFGLMLTGRVVRLGASKKSGPSGLLGRLVARSGEPVIRQALRQAMKILGDNFVLGRTIDEAITRSRPWVAKGYRFSYDMLGEGARTADDANRYYERYRSALTAVGRMAGPLRSDAAVAVMDRPGLSVKLSAVHPRFESGRREELSASLLPRFIALAAEARALSVPITIDAEEQDRLDITLDILAGALLSRELRGWDGLGIAVQAYGKRALPVLRWLKRLAAEAGTRIPVRLVKGAYWDSEIKWAQEAGLADYPVLTRKMHTDVSYLAAMRYIISEPDVFYAQFATHNAHTVATALVAAGNTPFEFQRLHGMGEALYAGVVGDGRMQKSCRIYAPVGGHEDLLAYLVRRLLENGANTSFVNRLADASLPVDDIVRDPVEAAEHARETEKDIHGVRLPADIFAPHRMNSAGVPLGDPATRAAEIAAVTRALGETFAAGPIVSGVADTAIDMADPVLCPHDRRERIGNVVSSTPDHVERAVTAAVAAQHGWDRLGGEARAAILERAAQLFEQNRTRLMAVIVREAGKTLDNALGDVREAVDFLRYYAAEGRRQFSAPVAMRSPTGENNTLTLRGRGAFVAISPWNFPLAIFTGQVAAALMAGNTVLAKPAEQTPITAFLAVRLLHEAGVPTGVLHLLTGGGGVGAALVRDHRTAGVVFTGSNETAWAIQKVLVERRGPILPFIAETGGINAMIADSSALPEQVVRDVVRSAFDSAGQRCSAARVLFVQSDVAPAIITMLKGAMAELRIGDPLLPETDIGPVIDETARDALDAHKLRMEKEARTIIDLRLPRATSAGTFVSPAAYEIDRLDVLDREVFGPILHVVRFQGGHLPKVVEAINASGYGLTLGLHSRIAAVADYVETHARVGNLYVNRNQIGAVVGVQPFGGEGLSGSGPKAGGPHYLQRFATERVRSTDITATGGNVELMGLQTLAAKP